MDTIRIRIKHPSTTPSRELCSPSRSVLYPEGEVGSSDCFISSVEHVIPWASTTRAGPPRPGTEFAVCWCSELARVGVDLARDGQMDRFLVCGSAGPPRGVSKASPCRKSGPNPEVGSTRVGSVRGHVSAVVRAGKLPLMSALVPLVRMHEPLRNDLPNIPINSLQTVAMSLRRSVTTLSPSAQERSSKTSDS